MKAPNAALETAQRSIANGEISTSRGASPSSGYANWSSLPITNAPPGSGTISPPATKAAAAVITAAAGDTPAAPRARAPRDGAQQPWSERAPGSGIDSGMLVIQTHGGAPPLTRCG